LFLTALVLIGWGAGELCLSLLESPDLYAVRVVEEQRTAALTVAAHGVSWAGSGYLLVPAAVMLCLVLYRHERIAAAALVSFSCAGAVAIFYLDKLLVGRPRPPVEHLEAPLHSSFPSGHATLATAVYLTLALLLAERTPPARRALIAGACVLVAAIAVSRVYIGVHYPSDVAAGALLGAGWTLIAARCVAALGRRRVPRRARGARARQAESGPLESPASVASACPDFASPVR
jgi:undecaprenyl-diphosphatase